MKKERGITLIALVITIIVLLILAGVSISLVLGNNGVLTKSKTSVTENRKSTAKEEVTMAWAACETDYLSARTKDSSISKQDFFEGNNGNIGLGNYLSSTGTVTNFIYGNENSTLDYEKSASEKYHITVNSKGEVTSIEEITEQIGEQTSGSESNSGKEGDDSEGNGVALSTITSSNYGDYIDLGQNVIGTSATSDDWRILYNDTTNNVVYAILADYLPRNNPSVAASGLQSSGTYSVYSTSDRDSFIAGLNHATAWNSLIPNSLVSRGATASGAASAEILIASYNEKHGTSLNYTDCPYLWNDPSNPPSLEDIGNNNYSPEDIDSLYMPNPDQNLGLDYDNPRGGYSSGTGCSYYYLATPYRVNCVLQVSDIGRLWKLWGCNQEGSALRPIVSLPSNIQVTNSNGVWSLIQQSGGQTSGSQGSQGEESEGKQESGSEENELVQTGTWIQDRTTITNSATNQTLEVGDIVYYDSGVTEYEESGWNQDKWGVLGVENGSLLLLSTEPVQMYYTLSGKADYLNNVGIGKLNTICEAYKNETYASSARSIKIEDINRVIGYTPPAPVTYTYTLVNGKVKRNDKKNPSSTTSFEDINGNVLTANNSIEVTLNSSYDYELSDYLQQGGKADKLLCGEGYWMEEEWGRYYYHTTFPNYYIASPYQYSYNFRVYWGLFCLMDGRVDGLGGLWYSDTGSSSLTYDVRAVVMLKSNIRLSGNSTSGWTIQQ